MSAIEERREAAFAEDACGCCPEGTMEAVKHATRVQITDDVLKAIDDVEGMAWLPEGTAERIARAVCGALGFEVVDGTYGEECA